MNVKGKIKKKLFPKTNTPTDNTFKIYSLEPSNKEGLVLSDYGTISIKGNLPELTEGTVYEFECEYEYDKKYDSSYKVIKILSDIRPKSGDDVLEFLCGIMSPDKAKIVYKEYPNIIDLALNDKPIETKNMHGIGEKTMNKYVKKIKDKLKYFELMSEYSDYNLTVNQMDKLLSEYSGMELLRERLEKNPYECLCSVSGIGFKTADVKILRRNSAFQNTPYRMKECILYVLKQAELDGNTYMMSDDVWTECNKLTPECIDLYYRVLEKSKDIYHDRDNMRVARQATYDCEQDVCDLLKKIQSNTNTWKEKTYDLENYAKVNGLTLTEQQQSTIPKLIKNNIVILAGYAGAGKSASCQAVVKFAEDNGYSYMLLAPTGRAAKVLSDYTERQAMTIHRGLGAKGESYFEYNENNKLEASLIIVDEASMVDVYLMRALLRALPDWAKILFVCDPAQIPSVGAGNVIQDMIHSREFSTVMLDKIFRYNEGGLSYVATNVRNGISYLTKEDKQKFGNGDYMFAETDDESVVNTAVSAFLTLLKKGVSIEDIVVVSAYNKGKQGTLQINNVIQSNICPARHKYDNLMRYTKSDVEVCFHIGDKVMNTVNMYNVECYEKDGADYEITDEVCDVYNGDFGYVKDITQNGEMFCDFKGYLVRFDKSSFGSLSLGYAVSCHKMQGDNRKYVILITPKAHTYMLNRNLIYVGLTRAKEKVYHYGCRDTITKALRKSENLSRKTFLEFLLKNTKKV